MKIAILSRKKSYYSTKRLVEASEQRGHEAKVIDVLRAFGTLCALAFVSLLTWHMIQPALDYIEFNEITMDLELPLIWKAVLIITGIGVSILAALVMFVRDMSTAIGKPA